MNSTIDKYINIIIYLQTNIQAKYLSTDYVLLPSTARREHKIITGHLLLISLTSFSKYGYKDGGDHGEGGVPVHVVEDSRQETMHRHTAVSMHTTVSNMQDYCEVQSTCPSIFCHRIHIARTCSTYII